MVKIFFPASGVGFSELCRIGVTFCHTSVSRIFEQNSTEVCGGSAKTFFTGRQACQPLNVS